MRTSIRFRLITAICAATLLIAAFSFLPVPVQADTDAEKATKKAEEEVAKAEQATKEVGKAQKDADEAMKKTGAEKTPEDKAADDAAKAADAAAQAADEAQDKAQKEQLEAEDAALDAKSAGGNDEEKNKKAADEKKEADDAAAAAKKAEEEANKKEKESNEADKKADDADKKIENRDVKKKKADARLKRRRARAARRAAAKAIRDAKRLLHEATRVGESSESKKRKKRLEDLEKQLKGLKKVEEDARKSEEPLRNFIPPGADQTAESKTANGLHTVTFDTLQGRVIVNLPDDMRAGDTISGTVAVEPKGNTEEERAGNLQELQGFVLAIKDFSFGVENPTTIGAQSPVLPTIPVATEKPFTLKVPPQTSGSTSSPGLGITLNNNSGSFTISRTVPVNPTPNTTQLTPPSTTTDFRLPTIGQQGRPMEIFGPFDGNSSNTTLRFGPARSTVQDFEKNTENVSGGFGLIRPLAESPRKMVFESPASFTGPVQLMLKEGDPKTPGPYRNVGVHLSAPKTNLLRGERTTLTVEVRGLEGLQKDVPLELDSKGVITMEGGNSQNLRISPTEVNQDGRYTTTRAITGQQAGAFTVTATVVVDPPQQATNPSPSTPAAGGVLAKPLLTQNERDKFEEEAHNMTGEQLDARLKDLGQKLEAEGRDHGTETEKYKRLKEELDIFNKERRKRK